jgi:hypothetical protein
MMTASRSSWFARVVQLCEMLKPGAAHDQDHNAPEQKLDPKTTGSRSAKGRVLCLS